MFEIAENTWKKAEEIQQQLSQGVDPDMPRINYLARYHEMKTGEGPQPMGIPELTHNFIAMSYGQMWCMALGGLPV